LAQIVENQNLEDQRFSHTYPGKSRQKHYISSAPRDCLGNTTGVWNWWYIGVSILMRSSPARKTTPETFTDGHPKITQTCLTMAHAQLWCEEQGTMGWWDRPEPRAK